MTTFTSNNHEDLNIEIGQDEEHDQEQRPSFSQPVAVQDLLLKEEQQNAPAMEEVDMEVPTAVEQMPMEEEVEHDSDGIEFGRKLGAVPSFSTDDDIAITKDEDDNQNDDDDNGTTVEPPFESAISMMTASAPPSSKKSPCQSRRNKLFAVAATIAILATVALSAGFGLNKNRSTTNIASFAAAAEPLEEDEVDCTEEEIAAMMAASTAASYPTYSPSKAPVTMALPTLPPAGSISNDFKVELDEDGAARRLRVNKRGFRGSQHRSNRKLKCRK